MLWQKSTPNQTKQHNQRLIMRVIYDAGKISRADIARATGLTRTTVSSAVSRLMADGLVAEMGQAPSAGGKPPTLLHIVRDARHLIGIDLSSEVLQGCVYNLQGQALHGVQLPITATTGEGMLKQVYQLIDELIALAAAPLLGIGLGTPGLLDAQRGLIHIAVNLNWHNLPLRRLLEERYQLPVYLVNDSQAAALAHYTFGNPRREESLVLVKAGRGIGAGIVLNGQLYHGSSHSGASEIGHVRVVEGGEPCSCGRFGCLETVASNRAVMRWAKAVAQTNPHSHLYPLAEQSEMIGFEQILEAYRAGDDSLQPVLAQVGHYLGIAIANLVSILNIPLIVLAGDVSRFGDELLTVIQREVHERTLSALAHKTNIQISHLGQEIVMLGAAALLLTHELGVV